MEGEHERARLAGKRRRGALERGPQRAHVLTAS